MVSLDNKVSKEIEDNSAHVTLFDQKRCEIGSFLNILKNGGVGVLKILTRQIIYFSRNLAYLQRNEISRNWFAWIFEILILYFLKKFLVNNKIAKITVFWKNNLIKKVREPNCSPWRVEGLCKISQHSV